MLLAKSSKFNIILICFVKNIGNKISNFQGNLVVANEHFLYN